MYTLLQLQLVCLCRCVSLYAILLPLRFGFFELWWLFASSHSSPFAYVFVCVAIDRCIGLFRFTYAIRQFTSSIGRNMFAVIKCCMQQSRGDLLCSMWFCCVAWRSHATFTFDSTGLYRSPLSMLKFTHVAWATIFRVWFIILLILRMANIW